MPQFVNTLCVILLTINKLTDDGGWGIHLRMKNRIWERGRIYDFDEFEQWLHVYNVVRVSPPVDPDNHVITESHCSAYKFLKD